MATPGERPGTVLVLFVTAPIARADIPGLCTRLRGLLTIVGLADVFLYAD